MLFLCSVRDSSWVPIDGESAINYDLPIIHHMENGDKHGTFRNLFDQDEAKLLAAFSKETISQNIYGNYKNGLVLSKYRVGYGWEKFFPLQFSIEYLNVAIQRGEGSYNLATNCECKIECYIRNAASWYGKVDLLDFLNGNVFERCPLLAAYRLRFGEHDHRNRLVINHNYQIR